MNEDIDLEKYFNLVHRLAKPYAEASSSFNVRESEAYSEGLLCLVKARNKFDPTLGFKFITYAYHTIKHGLSSWWTKNKRFQSTDELTTPIAKIESRKFNEEDFVYLRTLVNEFPVDSDVRFIFERRLEGLRLDDIARLLGCKKQNVHQLLHRRIFPVILEKMEKRDETRSKSDIERQSWGL